jgi:predicted dehydrogenase/threonine dehydrogenase-like Zn-dependent dehydrogenase
MKQVLYDKSGKVFVENVPVPVCTKDTVLVRVEYSLLSAGTEKSMIELMKKPLYKMALERPDLTKQVLNFAKESGIKKTIELVRSRIDVWHPLGYSCAGTVIAAGENATGFSKGDKVACCGANYANHAEYVSMPKNLLVKLPEGNLSGNLSGKQAQSAKLTTKEAAFAGVGSISMQSVRQLNPTIGETIVVLGLGLIGQLTAQILKANGCRVIGIDIDPAKTTRPYLDFGLTSANPAEIQGITDGIGADGVIIAASTKANLVNSAFDMCRRKGRVIMLGVCDMNIDRSKMYEKELDFRMSTSFGPGYYDQEYEEKGHDYPVSHVRWTAARNMQSFLELVRSGKVNVQEQAGKIYTITEAEKAYTDLLSGASAAILLSYPEASSSKGAKGIKGVKDDDSLVIVNQDIRKGKINVGLIGAGNFVKGFIMPNLKKIPDYQINAVATLSSADSKQAAVETKARYATTDYRKILGDKSISLVIIGTRHDTHAQIVIDAIKAKKHIFVEKPLAIYEEELEKVKSAITQNRHARMLAVGFNRRYSPYFVKMKEMLKSRKSPIIVNYVFNNAELPAEHWVNQRDVGGGRFIGEACHIMDLFNFLTCSESEEIMARSVSGPRTGKGIIGENNIVATIKYKDGSLCNLVYSCMGSNKAEKERCEVFCSGNVYVMSNFTQLLVNGSKKYSSSKEEGHYYEFLEVRKYIAGEKNSLITAQESLLATEMTFEVMRQVKGAKKDVVI